jgi:hypothetical protein
MLLATDAENAKDRATMYRREMMNPAQPRRNNRITGWFERSAKRHFDGWSN